MERSGWRVKTLGRWVRMEQGSQGKTARQAGKKLEGRIAPSGSEGGLKQLGSKICRLEKIGCFFVKLDKNCR